jgi:F-type H+-transporting ATPase subunit alpha
MTSDHDAEAAIWIDAAHERLGRAALGAQAQEIGRVEQVGDGIALVSGLPHARLAELLKFESGQFGFVHSLEADRIGCVLLDDVDGVEAGDSVSGTGDVVRTSVGPELLGRVVDPLGRPLDGKGPIATKTTMPIERAAPAIIDRDLVVEPVQTGLVVIDALFALGRGQRELIIGDRAIGKTTIGVDTIINQKGGDIFCIYVAIGQKSSSVRRAIDDIFRGGARERCLVVVAEAASSPGLQWIAPFAAMTMAEYFRDRGQHALIVLDDLTKHAATHREIALLTKQSPGREAYPGDVFYVHARLLERASKLSKEKGGGSLTALPIAETDAGNLSAYIPTNLISITDGQIVLDATLFYEGRKPAVDVGTSVSRVGGKTQARALRDCAETLRLDYAQFLELEAFTRFGGMSDGRVKQQLTRGARIRAILGQPQHAPLRLADEVALVLAVQTGLLDGLPLTAVPAFLKGLAATLDRDAAGIVASIQKDGMLDATDKAKLKLVLQAYAATCVPTKPS